MTERMENTINHIKTAVDVDPWAIEEVERVFRAIDEIKEDIRNTVETEMPEDMKWAIGLRHSIKIIDTHIEENGGLE